MRAHQIEFVAMRIVSTLELASLLVIVANRLTVHSPLVTSLGGPAHGILYLSSILLALLLPVRRSAKWLALVPGIGGLLALWRGRPRETTLDEPAAPRPGLPLGDAERAAAIAWLDGATAVLSPTTTIGPVSFAVPAGAITGLIGPNGAGKTTALRMLSGLVAPAAGRTSTDGTASRDAATPRIGVLIDSPAFLPSLRVRENLLALTLLAGWPPSVADRALERVDLAAAADRRAGTLSLGMKQRLGLAAALLGDPPVVILDEPTNGLDPRGARELRSFLRGLVADGTTVIISSHDLADIEDLCDHLVAMDQGVVVFTGTPATMIGSLPGSTIARTDDARARSALEAALAAAGLESEVLDDTALAVAGSSGTGARINRVAFDAGVLLSEIVPRTPSLEEAFLELTATEAAPPPGPVQGPRSAAAETVAP